MSNLENIYHGETDFIITDEGAIDENIDGELSGTRTGCVRSEDSSAPPADLGIPPIGEAHPRDERLTVSGRRRVFLAGGKEQWVLTYSGLSETRETATIAAPVINYGGGTNQRPIQEHPRFSDWAGDPSVDDDQDDKFLVGASDNDGNPLPDVQTDQFGNGSMWHKGFQTFLGFKQKPESAFFGLETFLDRGKQVTVSYLDSSPPSLMDEGRVYDTIPDAGVINDPRVTNWLLADINVTQEGVGAGKFFRVRKLYLGSGTEAGWPPLIYPVHSADNDNAT